MFSSPSKGIIPVIVLDQGKLTNLLRLIGSTEVLKSIF